MNCYGLYIIYKNIAIYSRDSSKNSERNSGICFHFYIYSSLRIYQFLKQNGKMNLREENIEFSFGLAELCVSHWCKWGFQAKCLSSRFEENRKLNFSMMINSPVKL